MSRSKNLLTLLTRYPRLGEVKTRLVPPLTAEEALALHDRLSRHALRTMLAVQATGDARCQVRTDAAFTHAANEWLGGGFASRYQGEGDLGDRIRVAFGDGFSAGMKKVVVIGSDCPRITSDLLRDVLRRLDGVDVVLGPATDGGYYLVGLRRETAKKSVPRLFSNIPWSTAEVLERTIEIAEKHGLSYVLLEPLPDVDRPEDVADAELALADEGAGGVALAGEGAGGAAGWAACGAPDGAGVGLPSDAESPQRVRVSAVIPALDDAGVVGAAVASAIACGVDEVIVVDGGSRDATRDIASAAGARVLEARPGRASQMNVGAAEATGGVLLFAHADTRLPQDAAALAREALAQAGVVAGAFSFAVPDDTRHAWLINMSGRTRHRLGGIPYGDMGLFLSARTFRDLGGYPEIPTMEDLELGRRLRRLGTVVVLPQRAVTSARAWEEFGLVWPALVNLVCIGAYRLGIDPETIATWRKRIRTSDRAPAGDGSDIEGETS